MKNLNGKVCFVTGGTRGIGRAIVLALARDGADVLFTYQHSKPQAEEVCELVRKEGGRKIVLGLVTGWGATVSDEVMDAHGIDFVVSKPFEVGTLASKVNETLAERAPKPPRSSSPSGPRPT